MSETISQLPRATGANTTDIVPATQGSTGPGTGVTRGITLSQILALLNIPQEWSAGPVTQLDPSLTLSGGVLAAAVQSVAGRTGVITLTHADITDASSLTGGPGLTYLNSTNQASVQNGFNFPAWNPVNLATGQQFVWICPFNLTITGIYLGAVVGGGSATIGLAVNNADVSGNFASGALTLSTGTITQVTATTAINVLAGQVTQISCSSLTGTISGAMLQLFGTWS